MMRRIFASNEFLFWPLCSESPAPDVVRRALVEVLMHGDRAQLVETLDDALLGLRPRPQSYFALRPAV